MYKTVFLSKIIVQNKHLFLTIVHELINSRIVPLAVILETLNALHLFNTG